MPYEVVIDHRTAAGEIFAGMRPPPRRSTGNHVILDCSEIEVGTHYLRVMIPRSSGQTMVADIPHFAIATIGEYGEGQPKPFGFRPD